MLGTTVTTPSASNTQYLIHTQKIQLTIYKFRFFRDSGHATKDLKMQPNYQKYREEGKSTAI